MESYKDVIMESVKAWSRVRDRSGGKGEGKGEIAVTDLSRTGTTRELSRPESKTRSRQIP
jgi:hypothetical protein